MEDRPDLLAALDGLDALGAGTLVVAKRDRLARDVLTAALVERLRETFKGSVVWDGTVQVFDLAGHPRATRAYAWSHYVGPTERRRFVACPPRGAGRLCRRSGAGGRRGAAPGRLTMPATTPWTPEQRIAIFESVWKRGGADCPLDKTPLRTKGVELYVDNYLIRASCPRCGNELWMGPKDDPLAKSFRPWTPEERIRIGDEVIDRKGPRCPVDETRLETREDKIAGKTWIEVRCHRCDQRHRESFPR